MNWINIEQGLPEKKDKEKFVLCVVLRKDKKKPVLTKYIFEDAVFYDINKKKIVEDVEKWIGLPDPDEALTENDQKRMQMKETAAWMNEKGYSVGVVLSEEFHDAFHVECVRDGNGYWERKKGIAEMLEKIMRLNNCGKIVALEMILKGIEDFEKIVAFFKKERPSFIRTELIALSPVIYEEFKKSYNSLKEKKK